MDKIKQLFKDIVLDWDFVKDALKEREKEGTIVAFRDAQKDLLECFNDDVEKRAEELADEKVSKLLGTFDGKKVITYSEKTGQIFLGGERIEKELIPTLNSEATFIKESQLWSILSNTIGDIARKTMFDKSQNFDDMLKGKMLLYQLSIQNKIIDTFRFVDIQKK